MLGNEDSDILIINEDINIFDDTDDIEVDIETPKLTRSRSIETMSAFTSPLNINPRESIAFFKTLNNVVDADELFSEEIADEQFIDDDILMNEETNIELKSAVNHQDQDDIAVLNTDFSDYPDATHNPFDDDLVFMGSPTPRELELVEKLAINKTIKREMTVKFLDDLVEEEEQEEGELKDEDGELKEEQEDKEKVAQENKEKVPQEDKKQQEKPQNEQSQNPIDLKIPDIFNLKEQVEQRKSLDLLQIKKSLSELRTSPIEMLNEKLKENVKENPFVSRIPPPSHFDNTLKRPNSAITTPKSVKTASSGLSTPLRSASRSSSAFSNPQSARKKINMNSTPIQNSPGVQSWLEKRKKKI